MFSVCSLSKYKCKLQFSIPKRCSVKLNSRLCYNLIRRNISWFGKQKEGQKYSAENINSEKQKEDKNENEEVIKNEQVNNNEKENKSVFEIQESLKFAEEKVKKFDYYAYIISNTLPPNLKLYYLSIYAFYIEILRSRYISKELSVCRIRLSFWEDSIKEIIQEKKIKEPVCILLRETFNHTGIRKETLFRLIDYQFYDLEKNGDIRTIEELEVFAENTRSLLLYLTLNIFNIDSKDAYLAASHLGRGIGIVDILKKMPALIKIGINQLPEDLIMRYGASRISLWDRHGKIKDQFYDCVLEVAAYAKKHIEVSRSLKDKLPKNTHIAFLQAVESYDWLLELEKYNFDIFEPRLGRISTRTVPNKMIDYGKKGQY